MKRMVKKHKIKVEGIRKVEKKEVSYLLEKEQMKELSDEELVDYRARVMLDKDVTPAEHWAQMWSCNSEMARRFKNRVEKRRTKNA